MTDQSHCQNCQSPMTGSALLWHQRCETCGLESSLLAQTEFNGESPIGWTDDAVDFLTELRNDNAHTILKKLSKFTALENLTGLDVGCAAGWFMNIANQYGMQTIGIEPDQEIAKLGQKAGLTIHNTFFPAPELNEQKVDLITFNDVFEHIEDSGSALEAVDEQLNSEGFLMINLPNADGLFYRVAKFAMQFGYKTPFERLWQKGYVSPHLHYFNHENLQQMCQKYGFKLLAKHRLPSIQLKGLWQRIRHNKAENIITSSIIFSGICLAYPFIRYIFPSDIIFHIYQKQS